MKKLIAACLLAAPLAAVLTAGAKDMPTPKVLQGMGLQKGSGQWKVEPLEGAPAAGGRAMPTMTVCTDNLAKPQQGPNGGKADPSCTHKLVKDTSSEAVIEATCKDRTTRVTMTREGAKSVLMAIESSGGKGGPQKMKMRYTHLGACSAGQGTVTFDKNSQQCQALRKQANVDPEATCARQSGDKAACVERMKQMSAQFRSMCGG